MSEREEVRRRLNTNKLSFVWLIFHLDQRGISTDKTEMSSVFAGTRKGAKADSIIQESVKILDDYEQGKLFAHEV